MATARSFMTQPKDESSLRVSSVQNCPEVRHGVVTTSHHIIQNINTIKWRKLHPHTSTVTFKRLL